MNFYFRRLFVLRLGGGGGGDGCWFAGMVAHWRTHRWNEDPSTLMRLCETNGFECAFADLWKVLSIWIRTQFALKNNIFCFYRIFRSLLGWPSKYEFLFRHHIRMWALANISPSSSPRESIKIIVNLYCRIERGKNRMKSANAFAYSICVTCVSVVRSLCACWWLWRWLLTFIMLILHMYVCFTSSLLI